MRLIAIDDEYYALKELMEQLREAVPDAEVVGYSQPEDALADLSAEPADVVFLDIEMGGMNGLELARHLKEMHRKTNVVFVTGHSQYALDAFALHVSGYLLKPVSQQEIRTAMEHLRYPPEPDPVALLRVQTFGNFEVFRDERPLHFSRSKAKELLAYLIHRRGASCTLRELTSVLYQDKPYDRSLQSQIQTVIASMMRTLREYGAEGVVTKRYNSLSVNPDRLDCDYYRFLAWDPSAVNTYAGEYMTNYDWAEFTIGYLDGKIR